MKRLHIIAEGRTEETFVNATLRHHLAQYNVFADVRCVLTGRKDGKLFRGGMTNYTKARNDILRWLNEEKSNTDVAFTTMFDFYALPIDFPGYDTASNGKDPYHKVSIIEDSFARDINDRRFIPYIQLHEFEALLFVNPQMLEIEYFEYPKAIAEIQKVTEKYGNPELIDQGLETAPSKRIIRAIPDYANNKATVGPMIAHEIGIKTLRQSCPHFNDWLKKLEQLA
jgi:hypothetical protein